MSKQMLVGWLTFIVAALALPQIVAIVPPEAMPYVACVSGGLVLLLRWLGRGLGVNPLSAVGAIALATGLLSLPELVGLIPVAYMPFVTAITALLTLLTRVMAGESKTDPASTVNLLMRTGN